MLTLQPTELVNECYLKLVRARDFEWNDRHHFFAISAKIMRRFIVDFLRRKGAKRRGGRMPFRIDADQVADGRWAWLTIAQVQRELGLVAAAKESLTQAESAFTDSGAADPALSTELRLARAEAANAGGETVTARSQAQTVVETNGEQAHRALYVVAQSLLLETKNEAALAALDDLQRRLQIDRAADTALGRRVQLTRATTLQALGEFARALEVLQALRRRQDEVLPADHPERLTTLRALSHLHTLSGETHGAARIGSEAVELTRRLYGDASVHMAHALNLQGNLLLATSRALDAEPFYLKAIELYGRHHGPKHSKVAMTHFNLGLLFDQHRPGAAHEQFMAAVAVGAEVWPADHRNLHLFRIAHALHLNRVGRHAEAQRAAAGALAIAERRPELKDYDVYSLGELARAVGAFGAEPSAKTRAEVSKRLAQASGLKGYAGERMAEQRAVAVGLGWRSTEPR